MVALINQRAEINRLKRRKRMFGIGRGIFLSGAGACSSVFLHRSLAGDYSWKVAIGGVLCVGISWFLHQEKLTLSEALAKQRRLNFPWYKLLNDR